MHLAYLALGLIVMNITLTTIKFELPICSSRHFFPKRHVCVLNKLLLDSRTVAFFAKLPLLERGFVGLAWWQSLSPLTIYQGDWHGSSNLSWNSKWPSQKTIHPDGFPDKEESMVGNFRALKKKSFYSIEQSF